LKTLTDDFHEILPDLFIGGTPYLASCLKTADGTEVNGSNWELMVDTVPGPVLDLTMETGLFQHDIIVRDISSRSGRQDKPKNISRSNKLDSTSLPTSRHKYRSPRRSRRPSRQRTTLPVPAHVTQHPQSRNLGRRVSPYSSSSDPIEEIVIRSNSSSRSRSVETHSDSDSEPARRLDRNSAASSNRLPIEAEQARQGRLQIDEQDTSGKSEKSALTKIPQIPRLVKYDLNAAKTQT
jgi:hypothetical protein